MSDPAPSGPRPIDDGAARKVLAVCLNPAWDITYKISSLEPGASHTVSRVAERAGGKGTNVARTLHQLHRPVHLLGLRGGLQGDLLHAQLLEAGIDCSFISIKEPTRRSVTAVDGNEATVLNEVGPVVAPDEWDAFLRLFLDMLPESSAVTLSGSLPPGLPLDAYAQLTAMANEAQVSVVLDATRVPLALAVAKSPAIVAPNRAEVADTFGLDVSDADSAAKAAQHLNELGANAAVISSGAEGLLAHCNGRVWRAKPPWLVEGNPTGAGDALTASLADGLAAGRKWVDTLRNCIAWSAAAVATPWAGELNEQVLRDVLDATHVEEI